MAPQKIVIIGGGPAGLMAAQQLVGKGFDVHLYDAMPSLGRKFLMAGKSGMNLTHNEEFETFLTRYSDNQARLVPIIKEFTPADIRQWALDLGIETFIGSSNRIFPTDFKAAPLLRSWLRTLRAKSLSIHVRHKWTGWQGKALTFETLNGPKEVQADAVILALGGVSWPKLGSDGSWQRAFQQEDIHILPFKPSNCGFHTDWSPHFKNRFAGEPVKSVTLDVDHVKVKGDFVITEHGVEGSAIYTHSRALRHQIEKTGSACVTLDLTPDRSLDKLVALLNKPRGSKSLATHLKRTTGLSGVKAGLLRECLDKESFNDLSRLAPAIKALPLYLSKPRPIEEAISCGGGVRMNQLDDNLMLKQKDGVFLAGEMLDWDAPTGGYLLTACFALGRRAGLGAETWLKKLKG